jgi:hypothetical protein
LMIKIIFDMESLGTIFIFLDSLFKHNLEQPLSNNDSNYFRLMKIILKNNRLICIYKSIQMIRHRLKIKFF